MSGRAEAPSLVLRIGIAALVAGAVFAAFSPSLTAGFLYWDDDKNFLENAGWRGLDAEHLRWMATTFYGGPYQPLSWLSLAIDHELFGVRPDAMHAMNLAYHAAGALAFLLLARKLFLLAAPGITARSRELAAGTAALLFAVHPLRVESVAWLTERRDVLSGCFYVLAVLGYLHAATARSVLRRRLLLALALAAYVLGLLAKASGMTIPLVLVLLDTWPLRRNWRETLPSKILFVIPAVAAAVVAYLGQAATPHELRTLEEHGVAARLAQACYAAAFYPSRTLLPVRLSPIHELPVPLDPTEPRFVAAMFAVAAATALLALRRRVVPCAWTMWAGFLVLLLPLSGLAQAGPQLVAERYSYLACMPFALAAAAALFATFPRAAPVQALLLVAVLGSLAWRQTRLWRDTETLFSRALAIDPRSPVAHGVVGRMLALRGEVDEAADHYRRAIVLDPDRPIPHNNLGLILLQQGRVDEAIHEFQETLRAQDDYARGRVNLGGALVRKGDPASAEAVLREALRRDPGDASARTNLGQALMAQDRLDEAILELTAATRLDPRMPEPHEGLARAHAKAGRAELAAEHARLARSLRGGVER